MLRSYVDGMQAGQVPTARDFPCPDCGGRAHIQAVPSRRRGAGFVNVSAWCEDCPAAFEAEGSPEWTGWERIRVELPK